MAEIKIRTPEDLDKVFTDILFLLYSINNRISNIEAEIYKMRHPTITTGTGTNPFITPRVTNIDDDTDMTKEIQGIIKAFKNDKKARE